MTDIFKTLGDDNRLRILNLLNLKELCVCEIEVVLNLSQSNVSRHLAKLRSAGLIIGYKDGQWMHYKISETFKTEHHLLMDYLSHQFKTMDLYCEDAKRCERYSESSYTCKTITADKNLVLTYLQG